MPENFDQIPGQEAQASDDPTTNSIDERPSEQEKQTSGEQKHAKSYREGQVLRLVAVRFPGHGRAIPFSIGESKYAYGSKVVAMSERGMDIGYINSFPYEKKYSKSMGEISSIARVASDQDLEKQRAEQQKEMEGKAMCEELISEHKLQMELTHVRYTQFGKKAVFYFTAPDRVDFRELVKNLVGRLKMRIELRQIYVRDRTASLGGIGPCGLQLCCSSFLSKYGHVNIKMAKNQNLTLSPGRLNGLCGQLKCCLSYEEDVYSDKRKRLPNKGALIETQNGDRGRVERLDVLNERFDMLTDAGVRRRYYGPKQFKNKLRPPKDWRFPGRFDNITDETQTIIGMEEAPAVNPEDNDNPILDFSQNIALDESASPAPSSSNPAASSSSSAEEGQENGGEREEREESKIPRSPSSGQGRNNKFPPAGKSKRPHSRNRRRNPRSSQAPTTPKSKPTNTK